MQSAGRLRLRNRLITVVAVIALILGVVSALFGLQASQNAAESQNLALISGSQAALANGQTDQAIALAIQAAIMAPASHRAQAALSEAAYAPGTIRRIEQSHGVLTSVDLSPDGLLAVAAAWQTNNVLLWNLQTGELVRELSGHHAAVKQVVFVPDGRSALSASDDGTLIL